MTANTPPLHLGVHWVGYGDGRIVGIDHATSEWLLIDPRGNRIAHVAEGIRFDLGAPWADPAVDGVGFFAQLQGQEHTLLELRFDGTLREAKLPASASDAERWPAIWKDERARTAKTSGAMGPIGIAGARALLALADGSLLESLDFGHSWHPVEGPPGGGPISELRCAEAGCLIDGFYRVGWGFE